MLNLFIWNLFFQKAKTNISVHCYLSIYLFISLSLSLYIYIFTNLISTSIHGTRKKKQPKTPRQEQEIKVSRITARGEKKKL